MPPERDAPQGWHRSSSSACSSRPAPVRRAERAAVGTGHHLGERLGRRRGDRHAAMRTVANIDYVLSRHEGTGSIRTACALLTTDAETAIGNLPDSGHGSSPASSTRPTPTPRPPGTTATPAPRAPSRCSTALHANGPSSHRCSPPPSTASCRSPAARPPPPPPPRRATRSVRELSVPLPEAGVGPIPEGRDPEEYERQRRQRPLVDAHRAVRRRQPRRRAAQPDDGQLGHAGRDRAEAGARSRSRRAR